MTSSADEISRVWRSRASPCDSSSPLPCDRGVRVRGAEEEEEIYAPNPRLDREVRVRGAEEGGGGGDLGSRSLRSAREERVERNGASSIAGKREERSGESFFVA